LHPLHQSSHSSSFDDWAMSCRSTPGDTNISSLAVMSFFSLLHLPLLRVRNLFCGLL
jgi:hypothetical protein